MTLDQLKEFWAKFRNDSSLFEKLKSAKSAEEIVLIAKENDYIFSIEHVNQLTDSELESISGGVDANCLCHAATTCEFDSQRLEYN